MMVRRVRALVSGALAATLALAAMPALAHDHDVANIAHRGAQGHAPEMTMPA